MNIVGQYLLRSSLVGIVNVADRLCPECLPMFYNSIMYCIKPYDDTFAYLLTIVYKLGRSEFKIQLLFVPIICLIFIRAYIYNKILWILHKLICNLIDMIHT